MKVLEVNDNDIYGKIFNGYQIMEELNKKDDFLVKQLVVSKLSSNDNCISLFPNPELINHDFYLHRLEHDIMSTHSLLSASTLLLKDNSYYKDADLVHFHQVHNSRFSLPTFFKMAKTKPTVISFHDPWFLTGRCVHNLGCKKWQNGCKKCENLNTIFDLPYDNCSELWNIKSEIKNTDIDIIVHSKYMYDMVKKSPFTKDLRIHEIPLGIDMSKLELSISKEEAKRKLNIFPTDIVIFFREQQELKGTDYIVKALKKLENKNNITILTCSQTGLLKEIENDFNIIELGVISEEEVALCYNASDLFLMPSLSESFGMMAVEAMACEVPVIVFNNSALPSTTGAPDVGILVNNLDVDDLYKKIKYYIENTDERIKRGKLSKEYVSKKYDYENYFDKIKEVYKEAYENQKYKLNNKYDNNDEIDFNNINVKKVLNKLNKIYDKSMKKISKPSYLKGKTVKGNDIAYSDQNVLNLIERFNNYLYETLYSQKRSLNILTENESFIDDNNKMPKVSIIIPVYNGEDYVSLAIDSALRQSYDNKEIIVVNDGSTDKTDKICKSYGDLIKYIKKENGGVSTALNLGIKNMTGEYFSWLSHDDLYYPEKLMTEMEYLRSNDLIGSNTILYSNFSLIDEKGELINEVIFDSSILNKDSAFSLLKGGINGLTLLIPKKAFKEVGLFDKNLRCIQDYKQWFEMYKKGYKFLHISNILACTRIHSNSVTNTSPRVVTEGNTFWIETIESFNDADKKRLYGSVYNYYFDLYNFFNYGPYDKTIEHCKTKFERIEKNNSKDINNIKVSVIIPFHNEISKTIRAVNSVINQTHRNIEILLVNNASTDDINELETIIKDNKNIELITLKNKESNSTIWNDGIKKSTGKFVAFLEPDNIFDSKKIETQLLKTVSSGDIISHTSYYNKSDNKSTYINSGYQSGYIIGSLINEWYINISTVMINRDYVLDNNLLFTSEGKYAEDICFYFEILKKTRILGIQEPLTIVNNLNTIDNKQRYNSIISYVFKDTYFDNFTEEKNRLLQYYSDVILNSVDISEIHSKSLERYEYLQTKEFNVVSKTRNTINKLLFKKTKPIYLIDLNDLTYSRLNKIYRKLRKIYSKIRRID